MNSKKMYYIFLFKRICKDKSVLIPLFVLIIGIIVSYSFNVKTANIMSYENTIRHEISVQKNFLEEYQSRPSDSENTEFDQEQLQQAINSLDYQVKKDEEAVEAYIQGNRATSYELQITKMEEILKNDSNLTPELEEAIKYDITLYKELAKGNFIKESDGNNISGFGFMFWVLKIFMPIFLTLMICVILSNLFTKNYFEGVDTSLVVPVPNSKLKIMDLVLGINISFSLLLLILLISFILGSIFEYIGYYNYPIITYYNNILGTEPLYKVIAKAMPLTLLGITFMVMFIQFLSLLIKSKLNVLFLSMLLLLGGLLGFQMLEPMKTIGHLLPTTYLYSVDVVTGGLMYQSNNSNLNLKYGIIILLISNIILFILIIRLTIYKSKNIKQNTI